MSKEYRDSRELFAATHDKFHRALKAALEAKPGEADTDQFVLHGHRLWDGVFFNNMPDIAIDYFINPYIKIFERAKIDPKTMAMCLLTSYLSREPKDMHGIFLWGVFAKECGATDEEVLECGAIAMLTNGKYQMVSIETMLNDLFASEEYKNATTRVEG